MIGAVTAGCSETKREGELDHGEPGLVGEVGELVDGLELSPVLGQRHVEALREHLDAAALGRLGAAAVAAGEPAAGERAPRDDAHPVALAGGQDVGLDAAREQRVGRLLADEALAAAALGGPLRLDDRLGGEGRAADVADLALADEVGEGAERLVDVGVRLGAVDLVEVDPVGAQAPQAVLDLAS